MAVEREVGETTEDYDPRANRPYVCGTDPSTCTWPVCDSGSGCDRSDGWGDGISDDVDPISGEAPPDVEPTYPEPVLP